MKGLKIAIAVLLLVMISIFLLGICILNQGGACGGIALAFLIVGCIVTIVGLIWDAKV